ncbi:MAG: hypothetical protein E7514_03025 [Ruminococcaceae bacterium]|nr:hypothetical protein [Oscillospiraceae bacterium]
MNSQKKENGAEKYAHIIDLPHYQSSRRKHMSMHDRAAQFAPFAALSGYDESIRKTSEHTNGKNK